MILQVLQGGKKGERKLGEGSRRTEEGGREKKTIPFFPRLERDREWER